MNEVENLVAVTPLKWTKNRDGSWSAPTLGGACFHVSRPCMHWLILGNSFMPFESLVEAKEECQTLSENIMLRVGK